MANNKIFNAYAYFSDIWKRNRLMQGAKFGLSRVSGIDGLPSLLNDREHANHLAVDTTSDGKFYRAANGGWFKRRVFSVFLLMKSKPTDVLDQEAKKEQCLEIARQIVSYMIEHEELIANSGVRLNGKRIAIHEFEKMVLMNNAGCYIIFDIDEPTSLKKEADDWL